MKRKLSIECLLILIMILSGACHRQNKALSPYRWPSVNPMLDSLTLSAEMQWMEGHIRDSLAATISHMGELRQTFEESERLQATIRWMFWKARYLNGTGMPKLATAVIDSAMQVCDSMYDPYTYHRLRELRYMTTNPNSEEFFSILLDDHDYYRKIGDLPQQATTAILISNSLGDSEPLVSLRYLNIADSLYSIIPIESYQIKNRINIANALDKAGNRQEALSLLESLKDDSIIKADRFAYLTVLRNHYQYTEDSTSLFHAARLASVNLDKGIVSEDTLPHGAISIRALFEALMAVHLMKTNRPDSAGIMVRKSLLHLKEFPDIETQSIIHRLHYEYFISTHDTAAAFTSLLRHLKAKEASDEENAPKRKVYLENMNALRQRELEANIRQTRHRLTVYMTLGGAILAIVLVIALFHHRHQRNRLKVVQTQLELEREQRKLMAVSLSKEESNKMLDYIRDEVGRLSESAHVSSNDLMQIDRNLRQHFAGRPEMESFQQTFQNVNPAFIKRLKEISPTISENNIRLCSYILIGLSNRQIAELMNVRGASVKQSRWRLRTRFGLKPEDSLEDFLRSLAERI